MPEVVELTLTIPSELGPAAEVIAEVRAGVEAVERRAAEDRKRTGARVLGRRRVLEQSWKQSPSSIEPRRTLRPRFAGRNERRVAALAEYKAFLAEYHDARARWLAGMCTCFPYGTYWLARFAPAPVTGPPS